MSELVNSQTEFMDPMEFIPENETPYFELKRLSRSKDFIEVSRITGAHRNIKHLNALANALELEILPDLKILNLQTKELVEEKNIIKSKLQDYKLKIDKLSTKEKLNLRVLSK